MTGWGTPRRDTPFGPPAPDAVNAFHASADTDASPLAGHHTLGRGATQASPGDHVHDGTTSAPADSFTGWLSVKDKKYGAKGDNVTDDWAAVQACVDDCPAGGVVFFPPGKYVLAQPLVLSANITLQGTLGNRWTNYTGTPCYLKPRFGGFTGTTGLVVAAEADGWRITDLGLHSGRATGTGGVPLAGLHATGACKGVRLANVWVDNHSGYGVYTDTSGAGFPGGWEVSNLDVENCGLGGWRSDNTAAAAFAFGDGALRDCESTANSGDGWYFAGAVALGLLAVRSSFDGGHGIFLDGPSGTLAFVACQTDRATKNGLYLHCTDASNTQPNPHAISVVGCHFRRDGRNDDVNQAGYAGIRVEGDSNTVRACLVTVTGSTVGAAKNDGGGGLLSPDYAVYATLAREVKVDGCVLVATVATVFDDSGAVRLGPGVSHTLLDVATGNRKASPELVRYEEEFLANLQQYQWLQTFFTGAGATSATKAGEAGRPGIHTFLTGSTAAGAAEVRTYFDAVRFGSGRMRADWVVRIPNLSTAAEEFIVRAGFLDAAGVPVDGAYFEYNRLTSLNWQYGTRANSVGAPAASATAVAGNTFYHLTVIVDDTAGLASFYIGGALVGTSAVNIPSGAGRETGVGAHIVKSAGVTSRGLDVDFARFEHLSATFAR